jgi:endonuclease IV
LHDLKYLVDRVGPRLKVCLDICHLHVDQYDLSTSGGREALFVDMEKLGWDNIAAIHVSDSQEVHGGRRDIHAG